MVKTLNGDQRANKHQDTLPNTAVQGKTHMIRTTSFPRYPLPSSWSTYVFSILSLAAASTATVRRDDVQPIYCLCQDSVQYFSVPKSDVLLVWFCLQSCFQFLSALGILLLPRSHMSLTAPHAVPDAGNAMVPKHVTKGRSALSLIIKWENCGYIVPCLDPSEWSQQMSLHMTHAKYKAKM